MAELKRRRIPTVLAPDSYCQFRTRLAPALDSDAYQFTDAVLIDRSKWILLQDAFRQIRWQNLIYVITREAERRLRKIVRAEGEELGFLGNLARHQARARQLNHCLNQVMHVPSLLFKYFFGNATDNCSLILHFFHGRDQRDHNLGVGLDAELVDSDDRFEDCPRLHLGNFGISNSQPASTVP